MLNNDVSIRHAVNVKWSGHPSLGKSKFIHFLCLCKNIERHCQRLESGIVVTIEDTLVGQVGLSDSYIPVIEESSDAADPLTSLVCHPEEVGFVKPTAAALCLDSSRSKHSFGVVAGEPVIQTFLLLCCHLSIYAGVCNEVSCHIKFRFTR